jgi:hypothetical protein
VSALPSDGYVLTNVVYNVKQKLPLTACFSVTINNHTERDDQDERKAHQNFMKSHVSSPV